jgi:hypothetical protein
MDKSNGTFEAAAVNYSRHAPASRLPPATGRLRSSRVSRLLGLAGQTQVGREPAGRSEGFGVVLAEHAAEAFEGVVLELAGLLMFALGFQGEAEAAD